MRFAIPTRLESARVLPQAGLFRWTGTDQAQAVRDIFKFRELPESETSKPFLEHLEDLRWTVVKMAMTLVLAMIVCFAFRSMLVRVMQAPLHALDPQVGS